MASQQKTRRPTVRSGKPPAHLGPKQSSVSPEAARKIIEGRQLPAKVYNPKTRSSVSPVPGGIILSATAPGSASGTVSGAENIVELARALKYDVDNIYAFVYENIEFLPTFGSQKGAWGTLVDGMGNSFDQSELMIELLREAGYTANFLYSELELTEAEVAAWLGTEPTDIWAASNLLGEGFIPNEVIWTGTEYKIRVSHCWVEVDIGGTDYQFDPSMKEYSVVSGIDLETGL